jgi:CBS domain-containing protein
MTCNDLMKKVVVFLGPDDTAQVAAKIMLDADVGFLPVCDKTGAVIGTLTDRDIALRVVAADKGSSCRVQEIMTDEVVSCRPEDDVEQAAEAMADNHVSRLLVCDDGGKLLGVISLSDLPGIEPERAADALEQVSERETHPQQ